MTPHPPTPKKNTFISDIVQKRPTLFMTLHCEVTFAYKGQTNISSRVFELVLTPENLILDTNKPKIKLPKNLLIGE